MALSIIIGGLVTSLIFNLVVFASYKISPESWLSDLTQGKIQSPKNWKTYSCVVAIVATIIGGAAITAWWTASVYGASLYEQFTAAWLVNLILNVYDVLVIDILIYQVIYPSWMRFEGIEPLHNPWVHIKEGLFGLVLAVPLAAIATCLTLFV